MIVLRERHQQELLPRPVPSRGCLLQRTNETDKVIAGINEHLDGNDLLSNVSLTAFVTQPGAESPDSPDC